MPQSNSTTAAARLSDSYSFFVLYIELLDILAHLAHRHCLTSLAITPLLTAPVMSHANFLKRIAIGITQQPLKLLSNTFIAYAALWAILEPLLGLVPKTETVFAGPSKFFTLLLISLGFGLCKSAVPKQLTIQYRNNSIVILFGDLFSVDGFRAIPVSRYFFETQIVPTSLQHLLIQLFVRSGEGAEGFDLYTQSLSQALTESPYQDRYREATEQSEKYYPLGTSAEIALKGQPYLLVALTETELKGHIPPDNCNSVKVMIALEQFWRAARVHSRGNAINIPLIGSGVTGIRLNPSQLLELNLLAIANAIEENGQITTEPIRIILHPKYIEDINLKNLHSLWH